MTTAADTETQRPAFRLVDPHELELEHPNWHNPRTITGMSKEDIGELAADIKTRGMRVRPLVLQIKNGDGKIHNLVIDGQRRTLAGRIAWPKGYEIEVEDYTQDPVDLTQETATKIMLHILRDVTTRSGLGSYEQSSVAVQLKDQGVSVAKIAAAIGRDASWVSRFLAAREKASGKVLDDWRAGVITDEQFKDLAALPAAKQAVMLEKTEELRSQGGKGKAEARAIVKEAKADHQRRTDLKQLARDAKETKRGAPPDRVTKKSQPALDPKILTAPPKPAGKPAMTSRVMLEEIVAMADKKPPLHDYMKGLMDGVRHALGLRSPADFATPWHTYLSRLPGTRSPALRASSRANVKAKKPTKAARPHRGSKVKPTAKAKARKPSSKKKRR
jgi:hypothetical protein